MITESQFEERETLTKRLLIAWSKYPTLRLGQFIINACVGTGDPYQIDDEVLVRTCEEYAKGVVNEVSNQLQNTGYHDGCNPSKTGRD